MKIVLGTLVTLRNKGFNAVGTIEDQWNWNNIVYYKVAWPSGTYGLFKQTDKRLVVLYEV